MPADSSIESVMERIAHLLPDFDHVVRTGYAKYRAYPAEFLIDHSTRTAANCVYDHILAHALVAFDEKPGIRPIEAPGGLRLWVVDDAVVFRIKKMDEDGKSRNYPTKQAKAFDRMRTIDGVPDAPVRVNVGYLLDATATQIRRVQVARPNGPNVDWCAAILPEEARREGEQHWEEVTKQIRMEVG